MNAETKILNETILQQLTDSDPGMVKQAQNAVTDFTRLKVREDGFFRRILPPVQVTNDDLDRQIDTDKPVIIVDKEPDSPAAQSIPFATLPANRYIRGPRYRVMFDRIVTPKFTKDVDELRSWNMDIRQVLSDNAIKDVLAEEDGKFIGTVNTVLVAAGAVVPDTGSVQWRQIAGGITRDSLAEGMKTLAMTPSHLNTATVLVNNVTIWDIVKFGYDEIGGNLSEELLQNGFAERTFLNARWIITIKRDLVPDSSIYLFAEPKFMGKFFILEDTTMYIDRKAYMLEFFSYETIGAAIGNVASVGRVDFI